MPALPRPTEAEVVVCIQDDHLAAIGIGKPTAEPAAEPQPRKEDAVEPGKQPRPPGVENTFPREAYQPRQV